MQIAEIHPVTKRLEEPRPIGIDCGMTISPSFFEPLPDDVIEGFEGNDGYLNALLAWEIALKHRFGVTPIIRPSADFFRQRP